MPTALRHLLAAALTGLALTLHSRTDWPWFLFGWVALVPWLTMLDRVRTLGAALLSGILMSAALVLILFRWLPSALQSYGDAPWLVCLAITVLAAPLIEPQFIAFALLRTLARRGRFGDVAGFAPLAGALAYSGADWAMPKLFADTLGHPLYGSNLLRQGADVAGAHGLTFVLVLANESVLALVRAARAGERGRGLLAPLACLVALVVLPLSYGAFRLHQLAGDGGEPPLTAALVQANLSHYDRMAAEIGTYDTVRLILDEHFEHSRRVLRRGDIDLLLWPETVYPTTFGSPKSADGAAFDAEIEAFAARSGVPLVLGAYDIEDGREFNAAFFLEPGVGQARIGDTYRKTWLFPFTERVPAWLDRPFVREWLPWLGTWTPGPGPKAVTVSLAGGRRIRVAPSICYDALDPAHALAAVRDGAEVIVTLSNDSWFDWGNAPELILVLSAFRSIETRRPQLRVTNTGTSAVITPTGEITGRLDMHQRGVLVGSVSPARGSSPMLVLGDWFGPTALLLAALALLASRRRR